MERANIRLHNYDFITPLPQQDGRYIMEKAEYIAEFVRGHGYRGDEMLMEPHSGIVASAVDFAQDIVNYYEKKEPEGDEVHLSTQSYYELLERMEDRDFLELVRVERQEDGSYVRSA